MPLKRAVRRPDPETPHSRAGQLWDVGDALNVRFR